VIQKLIFELIVKNKQIINEQIIEGARGGAEGCSGF